MTDAPVLSTERFELWRPVRRDLDDLVRLVDHAETVRFLGPTRVSYAAQWERLMRNAGSWSLYGYGTFMVRPRGTNEIVASCGIFPSWREVPASSADIPEAGWIVRHDHTGQGLAREVMQAVLAWFEGAHGSRRILCMIEDGNESSQRLAARLGFEQFGTEKLEEGVTMRLFERTARPE